VPDAGFGFVRALGGLVVLKAMRRPGPGNGTARTKRIREWPITLLPGAMRD